MAASNEGQTEKFNAVLEIQGEGGRLRDAGGIARRTERPAKDGRAGARSRDGCSPPHRSREKSLSAARNRSRRMRRSGMLAKECATLRAMRTVYHAEGIVDAHLVKDALENVGIPAFINGEYLIGGVGQLPARDFLVVSVPEIFAEDAGPVVRDITEMLHAPLATESADTGIPPLRLWPAPA
jgi:hypothetical protein